MTEPTKTITFEGQQYDVPVWVNWVARDSGGSVYGYDVQPNKGAGMWLNYSENYILLSAGLTAWDESLISV